MVNKHRKVWTFFSVLHVIFMSHLQRELWSLCGSLQGLLTVAGLQHHSVPLLGVAIRRHKVREALMDDRIKFNLL